MPITLKTYNTYVAVAIIVCQDLRTTLFGDDVSGINRLTTVTGEHSTEFYKRGNYAKMADVRDIRV